MEPVPWLCARTSDLMASSQAAVLIHRLGLLLAAMPRGGLGVGFGVGYRPGV